MNIDEYKTLSEQSEGQFKEKGSRFIALAIPVGSLDEVRFHLDRVRKIYHDARHHCYAYRLGEAPYETRYNDDGEPSGTAGKPIFGQIQSFELTNTLIIVVRYFGGVKLGTGGLIQAYRNASREALQNGSIINRTWQTRVRIKFPYELMNEIMHLVKEDNLALTEQEFGLECRIVLEIRKGKFQTLEKKLSYLEKVEWNVI